MAVNYEDDEPILKQSNATGFTLVYVYNLILFPQYVASFFLFVWLADLERKGKKNGGFIPFLVFGRT